MKAKGKKKIAKLNIKNIAILGNYIHYLSKLTRKK